MSAREVLPDNRDSAGADVFRDMMSMFPTGVSVITAAGRDGRPHGATCSSLSSVTLAPPTLLVCLKVGGATLDAIRSTRRFAVNLLGRDARRTAEVFAAPGLDRFESVSWRRLPSGLPHLHRDAFAVAECVVTHDFLVGDHVIVTGAPTAIGLSSGVPLLYGLRRFASWAPTPDKPEGESA